MKAQSVDIVQIYNCGKVRALKALCIGKPKFILNRQVFNCIRATDYELVIWLMCEITKSQTRIVSRMRFKESNKRKKKLSNFCAVAFHFKQVHWIFQ